MHPRNRRPRDDGHPLPSEITPEPLYLGRREFLAAAGAALLTVGAPRESAAKALAAAPSPSFSTTERQNSFEEASSYNNFYEFGTDKSDPARRSAQFRPAPWSVRVSGEAEVTGDFTLEDILRPHALQERIYRLRCVEAWSMVIPWIGFPLADLLKRFKPTSRARYVALQTVLRPEEMPGQRFPLLDWPYVEGLRIDEAMHPLAIFAVGMYGRMLPNQNGAPLRLVVPWKYGFKSIKSIVAIRFTERQPPTAWNRSAPREYGFYANVNPQVDHPRWSQARERRIGNAFLAPPIPTRLFNGYGEQVAALYRGMDLRKFY